MTLRHYLPAVVVGSVMWAFVYATIGFVGVTAVASLYARSPILAVTLAVFSALLLAWWIVAQVRAAHAAAPKETAASVT
jgi:membrane protein DedA with SNARE-associated domain